MRPIQSYSLLLAIRYAAGPKVLAGALGTLGALGTQCGALTLAALIVLGAITGCGQTRGHDAASPNQLGVVATTSMIADLTAQIGGERVSVTGLMGPGVDPHLYKASAGDVTRLSQADVILYNGLHLEGKMGDVFEQMHGRGVPVFAVAEESTAPEDLIDSERFQGNYDPHVWFDIALWKKAARRVQEILAEADPLHAETYQQRLDAYLAEMDRVHAYVREQAAALPADRRVLVTSHDAFGYFGRAYGFEVHGLQGISTASEAGAADVQHLADLVARRRIPAMFVETSISPRGIEAVQEAVRARGFDVDVGGTLYGDALGDPDSQAGAYLGMMRANIDAIVAALSRDPA